MPTKNFTIKCNQSLWDQYVDLKLSEGKKMTIIQQYKPVLLDLEKSTGKPFNEVIQNDLATLQTKRNGRNINHLRGFLTTVINENWLDASNDVVMWLIPSEYRNMVQMLVS